VIRREWRSRARTWSTTTFRAGLDARAFEVTYPGLVIWIVGDRAVLAPPWPLGPSCR